MDPNPLVIGADMPVQAIDKLLNHQVNVSTAVVNMDNRLGGYFLCHDVMVELWCQNYIPAKDQKVVDLMSRDIYRH